MKYLDSLTLAKISKFNLKVRYVVEGVMSGLHSSPLKGHSLEFAQHREYSSGDELRHIDWKIYGRTERFFVKQFQDETNLRAYILLDASASMGYSSGKNPKKMEYAAQLSAALAYLLVHQEDSVGFSMFDSSLRFFVPPFHRVSHLATIFDRLEHVETGGETDIDGILRDFARHVKKRSLLIVVSDLLDDPEKTLKALKYFRFRHHQIIVLQVLDRQEVDFGFSGENLFRHLETGGGLFVDADELRASYRQVFGSFVEKYKSGFRQAGIEYFLVTTDVPIEVSLAKCLTAR
ncbi:MAG: DUF58 domain-containing protein [Endomicrobiales bacterium]|nr:DUF58 domain-containing protein [Endomicrobiales bacterium]